MQSRRELLRAVLIAPVVAALPVDPVFLDEINELAGCGGRWVPLVDGIEAWARDLAAAAERPTYIGQWSNTLLVIRD